MECELVFVHRVAHVCVALDLEMPHIHRSVAGGQKLSTVRPCPPQSVIFVLVLLLVVHRAQFPTLARQLYA